LNEKAANRTAKDQKIGELQQIIKNLREEAARSEDLNHERQMDIKRLKEKLEQIMADRKFLYKHAREEKKRAMQLE
jgi:predicted RNase H-like nuclease